MERRKWLRVLLQLDSPDLAPIENCWLNKLFVNIPTGMIELIYEGWTHLSQKFVNKKIASMPERIQTVKDGERKMTDTFDS